MTGPHGDATCGRSHVPLPGRPPHCLNSATPLPAAATTSCCVEHCQSLLLALLLALAGLALIVLLLLLLGVDRCPNQAHALACFFICNKLDSNYDRLENVVHSSIVKLRKMQQRNMEPEYFNPDGVGGPVP